MENLEAALQQFSEICESLGENRFEV